MAMRIEQLYEQHIKPLPAAERLRLVEKIVSDLATQSAVGEPPMRRHWREICGAAPYPLVGEDAQAWVSRTRREADEHREKQWRREP
jgi:hypothetical protein